MQVKMGDTSVLGSVRTSIIDDELPVPIPRFCV